MKLFNTLTRRKEEFVPLEEGKVRMYVCGPTVYNLIHIGNARPMIIFDTVRRYMEYKGYEVNYVSNFTDVDDKIIKKAIEETTSDFDREKLQERLAKLAGGVAVIKVGAATETEMKEKKLRIEDALNATRAAVEEGIVAGGGTAYVNAVPAVEKLISEVEGDEKTGVQIIVKALQEPIRQIAANAGIDGSVVLEKIKTSGKVGYGFDAYKEVYCDMISAGIVDPAKVTRSALENAASVSAMVLTTESLVADKPEPPAPAAPAGMGDMGGMY